MRTILLLVLLSSTSFADMYLYKADVPATITAPGVEQSFTERIEWRVEATKDLQIPWPGHAVSAEFDRA